MQRKSPQSQCIKLLRSPPTQNKIASYAYVKGILIVHNELTGCIYTWVHWYVLDKKSVLEAAVKM